MSGDGWGHHRHQRTGSASTASTNDTLSPSINDQRQWQPDSRRSVESNLPNYTGHGPQTYRAEGDEDARHPLRHSGAGRFWRPPDPKAKKGLLRRRQRSQSSTEPDMTDQPAGAGLSPSTSSNSDWSPVRLPDSHQAQGREVPLPILHRFESAPSPDQRASSNNVYSPLNSHAANLGTRANRSSSYGVCGQVQSHADRPKTQSTPGSNSTLSFGGIDPPVYISSHHQPLSQRIANDERKRKTILHLKRLHEDEQAKLQQLKEADTDAEQTQQTTEPTPEILVQDERAEIKPHSKTVVPDVERLEVHLPKDSLSVDDLLAAVPGAQSSVPSFRFSDTAAMIKGPSMPVQNQVELPNTVRHAESCFELSHTDIQLPRTEPHGVRRSAELSIRPPVELPPNLGFEMDTTQKPPSRYEMDALKIDIHEVQNQHQPHAIHAELAPNSPHSLQTTAPADTVERHELSQDDNKRTESLVKTSDVMSELSPQGDGKNHGDSLFAELNLLKKRYPSRYSRTEPHQQPSPNQSSDPGSNLTNPSPTKSNRSNIDATTSVTSAEHIHLAAPYPEFHVELSASPSVIHHPRPKQIPHRTLRQQSSDLTNYNTLPNEPFPLTSPKYERFDSKGHQGGSNGPPLPASDDPDVDRRPSPNILVNIEPEIDPRTGRLYVNSMR